MTTSVDIQAAVDGWVGSNPDAVEWVLDALAESVRQTAAHAESNWQDEATARAWEKVANIIDRARRSVNLHKPG